MLVMRALKNSRYSLRWFSDGQEDVPYDFEAGTVFSPASDPSGTPDYPRIQDLHGAYSRA